MAPEGRNRDTDIGKGHVDTGWERAGGTIRESSPDVYTPSRVKSVAIGKLPYITRSSASCSVMIETGGMWGQEGRSGGKGYMYTYS